MKHFAIAALAAATFVAPLSLASPAAADNGRHNGWRNHHGRHDYDNRNDRRDQRDAYQRGYRDGANNNWDDRRYNGYWRQGRFYYGPPPAYYSDARFGYRAYRRGDRLPNYYAGRYRNVDYRQYHYAPPPRGYQYVRRDDTGETLLVGLATGVILGVILSGN